MKIAVPTNDGLSIAEHFGRSAGFMVFQTENGQIMARELKQNTAQHTDAQSSCGDHAGQKGRITTRPFWPRSKGVTW